MSMKGIFKLYNIYVDVILENCPYNDYYTLFFRVQIQYSTYHSERVLFVLLSFLTVLLLTQHSNI